MNDEQTPPPPIFVAPGAQPPPGYVPYYPGPPIPAKKPNGNATASMIISGGSLGLLFFSFGLAAPITVVASIVGTILGHKARAATELDETVGQRDEAVAGFWMGIAGIVLAVLAILLFIALIVFLISIDESNSDWGGFEHHSSPQDELMYPPELQ